MISSTGFPSYRALAAAALVCACATASAQAAADPRPQILLALQPHASVDRDRVSLRDVVVVTRDDSGVAERVLGLDLGPAPHVAQPAHLQRSQIADWVRMAHAAVAVQVQWSGAPVVDVDRASQQVSATQLSDAAASALDAWLSARSDSHSIELTRPVEAVAVPNGHVSLAVRSLPRIATPSARATVWIDVSVNGRFQRAVGVDYRVQAFRIGWLATEELGRGQDVDTTRLKQAPIDVAQLPAALWSASPDRTRMRRAVHRGAPLTTLDAEQKPCVVRGEQVQVSSHVGDLSIEAQAEALQDGREGQDVLVRIASSRAPINARVLKPGLVEIHQ